VARRVLVAALLTGAAGLGLDSGPAAAADNRAPKVDVTAPTAGATVSGTVRLAATASDRSGVAQVEWYVDGARVASDSAAPWEASWSSTSVANGQHTIVAKARDGAGNWGASSAVSVQVANGATPSDTTPPTVWVTSPAAGATVSGTVTLAADASDAVGVTQAKWYVDGVEVAWDGAAPWQASWSSTTVASGLHTIFAKAADAAGNWGTSPTISVTVATVTPTPTPTPTPAPSPGDPVIAAAGDIAAAQLSPGTTSGGQWLTDDLLDQIRPNAVLTLGDHVYETSTLAAFSTYYTPNWGRFKSITRAINGGSHDFYGGGDYYTYFGQNAGPAPYASYSYDIGAWHVVAINNYCSDSHVGGCGVGSKWYTWLKNDLAAHPAKCTLAYWHQPYWTSGSNHAPYTAVRDYMDLLYSAGADVLLSAHNHQYERFAPMDPAGRRDDTRGIQEFVVGTGGRSFYGFNSTPAANSLARNNNTFGVLKLVLHPTGWDWRFMPVAGQSFTDSGSSSCH